MPQGLQTDLRCSSTHGCGKAPGFTLDPFFFFNGYIPEIYQVNIKRVSWGDASTEYRSKIFLHSSFPIHLFKCAFNHMLKNQVLFIYGCSDEIFMVRI